MSWNTSIAFKTWVITFGFEITADSKGLAQSASRATTWTDDWLECLRRKVQHISQIDEVTWSNSIATKTQTNVSEIGEPFTLHVRLPMGRSLSTFPNSHTSLRSYAGPLSGFGDLTYVSKDLPALGSSCLPHLENFLPRPARAFQGAQTGSILSFATFYST